MTSRFKPGRAAAARLAGCALTLTLGVGLAGPAFAAAGPADPPPSPPSSSDGTDKAPPNPDKPPAHPENNDKDYYCRSDPNWYMCQKPAPKG
jgi:hypothetical protein